MQDQASRERLCLAVLAMEGGYSNPRPRRPAGGPDEARDIEAYHKDEVVWAAVGFRNSVSDSRQDRAWAAKKFKRDLASARAENSNLRAFAFFTNVDLTPTQTRSLEQHARTQGFDFVDIFIRERIRIHIDSPRGLSIRYQYLEIPLSDAEQKTFFAQWSSDLERLIHSRLGILEEQIERLEFLHSCQWPLKRITLEIELDREYSIDEIGHFRALAVIFDQHERSDERHLYLGVRDSYVKQGFGQRTFAWFRDPGQPFQESSAGTGAPTTTRVVADAYLYKRTPLDLLKELDQCDVVIYMTERLASRFSTARLVANDYEVLATVGARSMRYQVITEEAEGLRSYRAKHGIPGDERWFRAVPWPKALIPTEAAEPWVAVGPQSDAIYQNVPGYFYRVGIGPDVPLLWTWTLDFRSNTLALASRPGRSPAVLPNKALHADGASRRRRTPKR